MFYLPARGILFFVHTGCSVPGPFLGACLPCLGYDVFRVKKNLIRIAKIKGTL